MIDLVGKKILHYKIIEKLGEGGMGIVYLADDSKLKRQVAIKFLPKHISVNSDERKRFEIEAQAAASLNHTNIATIYSIEEADDELFIVMEYIKGSHLKDHIDTKPFAVEEALDIAHQIASGLQEAHNNGIVHRDIKSANIMINEKGIVKIMDFGLAKVGAGIQLTKEQSTLGTAAYMSPEQARGEEVDHRSDIWSFGVVLYEMLAGSLPFKGDYEQVLLFNILNEPPADIKKTNADISDDLISMVLKCLDRNPDERYENLAQLLTDLNKIKNEVGNQAAYGTPLLKRNSKNKKPILVFSTVIISVLILSAIFYFNIFKETAGIVPVERKLLLVLPFQNIGNDPSQEFFSDGMTEEMIMILGNANPKRLGVIARTSAMHYKKKDVSIKAIGKDLGVGYILEGSVRRQKEQVRITVKLIKVEDQTQLWSKSFDGTMDDIFVLQSNVANQIAKELAIELLQGLQLTNRTHEPNPKAYEEYLTGRFFAHKGTAESWPKAIYYYEEAIRIDPEFALVYAALSHAYSAWSTFNAILPKNAYDKAKAAAEAAFQLDPNLADAHSALAFIALFFEWNWQKAEEQFRIALELNPSDGETYHFYGHFLLFMDRDEASIEAFHNALKLDPLSAFHRSCMASSYLQKEEFGLAESSLKKALELAPEQPLIYYMLGFLKERQDKLDEAILAWEKAVQYSNRLPMYLAVLGYGYGKSGQADKAHKILDELAQSSRDGYVASSDIAKVYAGMGMTDRAFEILEKTYTNHEPWIFGLKVSPGFDTIRDDPRFHDLLRRIGVKVIRDR